MSDTLTDAERVRRLLAVIAEYFEDLDPEEFGGDYGVEFFERAGDWRALLAEVDQMREALGACAEAFASIGVSNGTVRRALRLVMPILTGTP